MTEAPEHSNEELLRLTGKQHDEAVRRQACELLFKRLGHLMEQWVANIPGSAKLGEPCDFVQTFFVFVLAGKFAVKYDGERKVEPWFHTIIHNIVIDALRRGPRYRLSEKSVQTAASNESPLKADIAEICAELNAEEKIVLMEFFQAGKNAKQVAAEHPEIPESKVYAIARRLRRLFGKLAPAAVFFACTLCVIG